MSRNIVDAQKKIFGNLDRFCSQRGVLVSNAGQARHISVPDRHFFLKAKLCEHIWFGGWRRLARLEVNGQDFYCWVGFQCESHDRHFVEIEIDPGHLVYILSEMSPRPVASPAAVKNVVEVGDMRQGLSYTGHDLDAMLSLFPKIQLFQIPPNLTEAAIWADFFVTCINEIDYWDSWIDQSLCDHLKALCILGPERIPYHILCRAVLDGDPSSLFLALYRCCEQLYSATTSRELSVRLGLTQPWEDVAEAVESLLGWRPREDQSLVELFRLCEIDDVRDIISSIHPFSAPAGADEYSVAAGKVYKLRNTFVHFRPALARSGYDTTNWNQLCKAMASAVYEIYQQLLP